MKVNYLFAIFFFSFLKLVNGQGCSKSTSTQNRLVSSVDSSLTENVTWGKISGGKFYTYSVAPSANYPDVGKGSGEFTHGIEITDEKFATTSPLSSNWVGFANTQITIVLDLGKSYAVSNINMHALSNTTWGIKFPKTLTISTQDTLPNSPWLSYTVQTNFPANTSNSTVAFAKGEAWVNARYVKFIVTADANVNTFIDEIEVYGSIVHTRKYLPAQNKCYHGAFPADNSGNLAIANFESLSQRKLKMVLWYEVINDTITYDMNVKDVVINGAFANYNNNNPNPTEFMLQLGTQIKKLSAYDVAMGKCDTLAKAWFYACKQTNYPTFIRLLSEMNGWWTFAADVISPGDSVNKSENKWGGNPTTYIQAWRRLYNIAEKLGSTGQKQIFVWSPQLKVDYFDHAIAIKNMENYYPGHQYVDWVGGSIYNSTGEAYLSVRDLLTRLKNIYGHAKPMMISEGGMEEIPQNPSAKFLWILEWWSVINEFNIRAAVWFHRIPPQTSSNYKIDSSNESLKGYRPYLSQ